ncbi:hypothetical protein WJX74_007272 [Apatococcus lobatus]|uniref:RING-type domain-containing protein n=1 Tax=Apatococcus lobatus TaxID=904363 RepID=A0AAW1QMB7_9CHLO
MLSPATEHPPRRGLISHRKSDFSGYQQVASEARVSIDCRCTSVGSPRSAPRTPSTPFFRCPVCLERQPRDDIFVASHCQHEICRPCARHWVLMSIGRSITSDWQNKPLSPLYVGHGPRSSPFAQPQICCNLDADVQLLLDGDEYEGYLNKSLKAATHRDADLVQCPQPDCEGIAAMEPGEAKFVCPLCSHRWCRFCKTPWHAGMRCEQMHPRKSLDNHLQRSGSQAFPSHGQDHEHDHSGAVKSNLKRTASSISKAFKDLKFIVKHGKKPGVETDDDAFAKYLKKNKTLQCPMCGHGIQKTEGNCNHVMCGVCKTHICWLCGEAIPAAGLEEAQGHYWIKGTPCYGMMNDDKQS